VASTQTDDTNKDIRDFRSQDNECHNTTTSRPNSASSLMQKRHVLRLAFGSDAIAAQIRKTTTVRPRMRSINWRIQAMLLCSSCCVPNSRNCQEAWRSLRLKIVDRGLLWLRTYNKWQGRNKRTTLEETRTIRRELMFCPVDTTSSIKNISQPSVQSSWLSFIPTHSHKVGTWLLSQDIKRHTRTLTSEIRHLQITEGSIVSKARRWLIDSETSGVLLLLHSCML
jgi:hypothetical protein